MKRESNPRLCPVCSGSGITRGDLCQLCRGTRRIILSYDYTPELEELISEKEFIDSILDAMREQYADKAEAPCGKE